MDPLVRIFGNPLAPVQGVFATAPQVPRKEPWPHFEADGRGFVTPVNFDNDAAIQLFEESLKEFTGKAGPAHPGVPPTALGLARLYDMKGGHEKDVAHYDKAIEYLQFCQSALEAAAGQLAKKNETYQKCEKYMAKMKRKKERRLAKVEPEEQAPLALQHPSSRVIEVVLVSEGRLAFRYEDGTQTIFSVTDVQQNARSPGHEFDDIDDDFNETTSAPPFTLHEGEFIVGMITNERHSQDEVNAIVFHTNKGRRSSQFKFSNADPLGREYYYFATKGSHLTGLMESRGKIAVPCGITEGKM
jgi:hypothetical protein